MLRHWSNVYIKDSEQKQHTNKLCTWSECFGFWVKTLVNNTLSEAHNVYRCFNCLDKVFYVLAQDLTATPEGQNRLTLQLPRHSDVNRLPELKVLFFYSYRCCDIWTRQGRVKLHRWVWNELSLKEQMHVWVMVMKWTLWLKKAIIEKQVHAWFMHVKNFLWRNEQIAQYFTWEYSYIACKGNQL